jgi:adenine-specific DNA-methyltransferase
MPILNWIGKEVVVNHDKDVPFRLLKKNKSKSVSDSENLIIEGDNLEALKALLPHYQNKIKCIYIDPPYNTGKEHWKYNDNVNSPIIKKWFESEAFVDDQDLSRHAKWACMIYPRIKILNELLSEEGLIFVSIGDDEIQHLKMIMNELFGKDNFVAQFVWNTEGSTDNTLEVKIVHEYVLLYAKNIKLKNKAFSSVIAPDIKEGKLFKSHIINTAVKNGRANPTSTITLPKGFPSEIKELSLPKSKVPKEFYDKVSKLKYISRDLTDKFKIHYPIRQDTMNVKNKVLTKSCKVFSGWGNLNKLKQFIENKCKPVSDIDGDFSYFISKMGVVTYQKERKNPRNILSVIRDVGTTTQAKTHLENMGIDFDYPKPVELISYLIKMSTDENSIILDSFAGSGTTAEAVLKLNKEDQGNRKFILIELEPEICRTLTSQRVKKVIEGYPHKKSDLTTLYEKELSLTDLENIYEVFDDIEEIKSKKQSYEKLKLKFKDGKLTLLGENTTSVKNNGTGGSFQYVQLDKELFNSNGAINESCTFKELSSYIYFTETKTILDVKKIKKTLLNFYNGIEYHLIFNKIGKNILDTKFLNSLNADKTKVIYADKCTVSEDFLDQHNTVFKQIPYEIRVF